LKRRQFNRALYYAGLSAFVPLEAAKKRKRYLQKGDTIGLITPAGAINETRLANAIKSIQSLGFKTYHTPRVLHKQGYLAGSDADRLFDLHQMFVNPEIDGIWCIRGGYGTTRILDQLDFRLIKNNPKPLIGYSDITALLNTIHQRTGNLCFHGPVGVSTMTDYSIQHFASLYGIQNSHLIHHAAENISKAGTESEYEFYNINPGQAKGQLAGGNLTLICSLLGTDHEVKTKNRILFFEDIGEEPYRIDRMLTQLISSGVFKKVKGIMVGICAGCERKDDDKNQTLKDVILDRIKPLGIPAAYGFSFGHIDHHFTIPLGCEAEIDFNSGKLILSGNNYKTMDQRFYADPSLWCYLLI